MRIQSGTVAMVSQHEARERYIRSESVRVTEARPSPDGSGQGDRLELSAEARVALAQEQRVRSASIQAEATQSKVSAEDRLRILILEAMLGIKVKVGDLVPGADGEAAAEGAPSGEAAASGGRPARAVQIEVRSHEVYEESERLEFAAGGVIQTSDGKQIKFSVQFSMSRSFRMERDVLVRTQGRLVDPLVINFDGALADLTDRSYRFDLDADGSEELIRWVSPGSGFLALDVSGDGVINDGRELFGPMTGNGFSDLAKHDSDRNGWIDEHDPVYDRLRIWTKDSEGQDRLLALGQVGVGAIFLGNLAAGFTMKDANNQALAQNQRAGIFLREDGTAGTVQQLDMIV